jgi:hypothetical protein
MLLVSDLDVRGTPFNGDPGRLTSALYQTQLIKQVIADDPPKADYNINVFLGQGLVSACGDVWRHDRR